MRANHHKQHDGTLPVTFGKHNGKTIEEIPSSYLKYIIENWDNHPDLQEAADAEYNWRTEWKCHF